MSEAAVRRALRGVTVWLTFLTVSGLGVVVLREPPDQHFGIEEWFINFLAAALAFSGGWAAIDLLLLRRSGRATAVVALGLGLLLFGGYSFQALRTARETNITSSDFVIPALACGFCAIGIAVVSQKKVADQLRASGADGSLK